MNEIRKILDLFYQHDSELNSKIASGIEKNRKGIAKITLTDEQVSL